MTKTGTVLTTIEAHQRYASRGEFTVEYAGKTYVCLGAMLTSSHAYVRLENAEGAISRHAVAHADWQTPMFAVVS